jgi:hypothetical protein
MEQNEFEVAGSFGVSREIALRSLDEEDEELDEFVSTRLEPGDEPQGQEVSEKFYAAAKSLSGIYHNAKRAGCDTYGHILSSSRAFKMSLTEKLRQARKERPLHFLGAIAFAGLALGISARLWSSRHHG